MKCKNCGQELTINRENGIGVCPDCGKMYKVSTVIKPKVCSVCSVNLVKNGDIWECPKCGKKFVFTASKKKEDEAKKQEVASTPDTATITPSVSSDEQPKQSETIPVLPDEKEETKPTDQPQNQETDESANKIDATEFDLDQKAEEQNDQVITPESEDDDIIDDEIDETADNKTTETENVDNKTENELPTLESKVPDSERTIDLETSVRESQDKLQGLENTQQIQNETEFIVIDEEIDFDEPEEKPAEKNDFSVSKHSVIEEKNESKPQEKVVKELPKLYDYDGSEYSSNTTAKPLASLPKTEQKPVQTLESLTSAESGGLKNGVIDVSNGKGKKKGKSKGMPFAIAFGILIMLTSIGSYALTLLQAPISNEPTRNLFASISNYLAIAFYLFFAISYFGSLRDEFGDKRIAMFFSGLCGVAMVVVLLLGFLPDGSSFKEKLVYNADITVYGIYGCYVFSSFITLVISCETEVRKKVTSVSIASFILAIVSLVVLALRMLPLEKMNMSIVQVALPFINGLDKVILACSVIPILTVTAKSI